jgi:hypothetical protein
MDDTFEADYSNDYDYETRDLTPGELERIKEQEARFDINVWLNTGRTDQFTS